MAIFFCSDLLTVHYLSFCFEVGRLEFETCYALEYGVVGQPPLYPRYIFGYSGCKSLPEYRFDMFKDTTLIPQQFVGIGRSFYFTVIGQYYFRVIAKNAFALHTELLTMNLLDAICFPPTVSHVIFQC